MLNNFLATIGPMQLLLIGGMLLLIVGIPAIGLYFFLKNKKKK